MLAAVAGIAFAAVLILVQLGFKAALIQSAINFYAHLKCDVAIISPGYQYLLSTRFITQRRLYQAQSLPEVTAINHIDVILLPWKDEAARKVRLICVIAFEPRRGVFDLPEIDGAVEALREPDTALLDSMGRPEFSSMVREFLAKGRAVANVGGNLGYVGGHDIKVIGLFPLGTSFAIDDTLIMSDLNFWHLCGIRQSGLTGVGLITLRPGTDAEAFCARLRAILPHDVIVLTRRQLMARDTEYWLANTPIGFIFNLGVLIGLFVGCIIVYQILYTDVNDHLNEYATLKAMGYADARLFAIVLQEAIILSVLGFVPGLAISMVVYGVAAHLTLLPLRLTVGRVVLVYVLTAFMCAVSASLAMQRLRHADPAEIF